LEEAVNCKIAIKKGGYVMMDKIEKYGIPARDLYDIPTSGATFPDGAHYRMER